MTVPLDPAFLAVTYEEPEGPVPVEMGAIAAQITEEMAESVRERMAINDANAAANQVPPLRHGDVPGMG